ncbi:tetratricopeptide repeat protein [Calothrix sp. 336/3]|uniref:tetratricopeptide repeat protein n=1 Tax=Calothrix sp. 336/3 TaxID=1337936 RepID=UPI0004E33CE4|nr:tetratricopeptide repeat protein [Calothrix sp. 336/3]AKG21720.1 tetratricopeptide TPR_1 repeat-containing protein [Calothrix sp. 336/3]
MDNIFSIGIVGVVAILLIYFAVKTIITSNYFQQGINLYEQKDYVAAEAAFRKVLEMNSTNDAVHLFLGSILVKQERVAEAIIEFEEVIRRAPKKVDPYLRLADICIEQQNQRAAIAYLEAAKELLIKQKQPQKAAQVTQLLTKLNASN